MNSTPSIPTKAKVLLVDDDELSRQVFVCALEGDGYEVVAGSDGTEAIALNESEAPDLILLDVSMPGIDGWKVLDTIRERGCSTPVIMLTGATRVEDRVRGLSAGADDYLCKPCDFRELLARVGALLRRKGNAVVHSAFLRFGDTTVDLGNRVTKRDGQIVELTRTEYAILDLFSRHEGKLVTREMMLESVWGYTRQPNTRTVDTHIWRLRNKLGDQAGHARWITTVPAGNGYRMVSDRVLATV